MNEEAEQVFHETAAYYEQKYWKIAEENKHLKQQLSNKNKKIKELKRVINKKNNKEKQHFKNGKRGSMKNGG